jgi:hypothetical protein
MLGATSDSIRYLGDDVALAFGTARPGLDAAEPSRRPPGRPQWWHQPPSPAGGAHESAVTSRDGVKSVVG